MNLDTEQKPSGSDLRVRCKVFGLNIIKFVDTFPRKQSTLVVSNQLLRSALSVGANLFESKGAGTQADFKRFNEIALKSANETIYWLSIVQETEWTKGDDCSKLLGEIQQIARMIASGLKGWRTAS